MKHLLNLLTLAIFLMASMQSSATILVANNNTTSPGQYATLQSAIDAATDGDTIHVEPSNFIYDFNNFNGNINLNKSLTLIGIGNEPNKDIPYASSLSQIRMSGTACSLGATFIGLKMGGISMACGQPIYNLHISHCDFSTIGGTYESNCFAPTGYFNTVIEHSIIGNTNFTGFSSGDNILFNNVVFYGYQHNLSAGQSNVIVKNSLFLYFTTGDIQGTTVTFENNIFYKVGPNLTNNPGLTNCVFNNNLFYQNYNDDPIYGSNTGADNIISQDPLFENYVNGTAYSSAYNFRLQELSPGHNAGTDGQDIGLYGGNNVWSETGEHPTIPVVREMNIENSVVPSQGTITVHVKSTVAKTDNP
jgi:hypothetical protein